MLIKFLTIIAWVWAIITSLWAVGNLLPDDTRFGQYDGYGRAARGETIIKALLISLPAWIWLLVRSLG